MNAVVGPNPLEILLLILLGGGNGLPPGVPPAEEAALAAKVAPAECVFYMSWAGTGIPDKDSGNQVEQLLAEPEVRQFVTDARRRLLDAMRMGMARQEEVQQALVDGNRLLELVQGKAGAVFISDIHFAEGRDAPVITGGALVRMGEDLGEASGLLEKIQGRVPEESVSTVQIASRKFSNIELGDDAPAITWGAAGEYLVVGVGEGSLEGLIQRARGDVPGWLTAARERLEVLRFSSMVHLDVKRIVDLAVEQSGDPEVAKIVSALGLDQIGHFTTVSGLDDIGCLTRSSLEIEGPGRGLLKWIDSEPLNAGDLKAVAHDAPLAVAFKLDTSWLLDLWIDVAEQIDPNAADDIRRELPQMNAFLGIDVQKDLIGSLGDAWKLFVQPGPEGLDIGWTIAIEVRDREKLEQVHKTLIAKAKAMLEQFGGGASIVSEAVDGLEVHTLELGQPGVPLAPSWCLAKDELLITTSPQSLKKLLSSYGKADTLVEQPDVAPLFDTEAATLAMAYADTRRVVDAFLPVIPMLLQVMGPMGPAIDTSNLPPSEVITKHLSPSFVAVSRTADGLGIVSRRSLPGASIETGVPFAAAMLMPAVGASREAARRAQSSNQLKQIGIAMHNYHDTFKAFPAGYSADEEGTPLLSWRVHILPFIEQSDLYEQFHFDEPWDSPHNKKLIERMPDVYKAPGSKCEPGMTNYLGVGGADGVFVRPGEGAQLKNPAGSRFADITDGTSNTIMVVEASDDLAIPWTQPGDYAPDVENPVKGLPGLRPGGFQAAFTDGSVRFISEAIDLGVLNNLFMKSDGQAVNMP